MKYHVKLSVPIWVLFLFWVKPVHCSPSDPPSPLEFGRPWEIVKSSANIKVYQHPWPYQGIRTFKVDMKMNASMESLLSIIVDIDSYPLWIPNCKGARVLEKQVDGSIIYYIAMDLPWPAADRDWVNKLTVTKNKAGDYTEVRFTAIDDFYPIKDGYIRVTAHLAQWILIPLGTQETRSIWQWYTDPGGHLPVWLIEWASREKVMESIDNILRMIPK